MKSLSGKFADKAVFGKVDVDNDRMLGLQYKVEALPTILFFKDGVVVDQMIGNQPKNIIADRVNELLK